MYTLVSDILKYVFVVVVYVFIYSVVKLVYLDISDARRMSKADEDGYAYLKLINLRKDLNFKIYESYSIRESATIGRSKKCDIYINSKYMSKIHARIFFEEDKFFIEDPGSTNGTFVNGKAITTAHPVRIKDNDKISFGNINFIFVDSTSVR